MQCLLLACFTGEEIKLYDSGEEVSFSTNYKGTEVTETAVSGETRRIITPLFKESSAHIC